MATNIRAHCGECLNEVDLRPDAVHITILDYGNAHSYTFFCPSCGRRSRKPADDYIIRLLTGGGVGFRKIHVIEEAREIIELSNSGAPAISPDDVMDFHLELKEYDGTAALPL